MDIGKLTGFFTAASEDAVAMVQALMRGEAPPAVRPAPVAPDGQRSAAFLAATYSGPEGSRPYKLFVPSGYHGQRVPLLVMLHACAQSPDDFAAGTRMNALAEQHACLVAYPAQTQAANMQRCWNWFNAADQQRGSGEAALLAGLTRQIIAEYAVDPARVYVAGLSAGGAGAAILGARYPELFAAIGVHSGLACGAARDMPSGFAAMGQPSKGVRLDHTLPAIVFHGDRDGTVHPGNGDQVIVQALAGRPVAPHITAGKAAGGLGFSVADYRDSFGSSLLEHWVVFGAGHAWSGGSADGSYTEPRGPDASAEMLRFFLAHPKT